MAVSLALAVVALVTAEPASRPTCSAPVVPAVPAMPPCRLIGMRAARVESAVSPGIVSPGIQPPSAPKDAAAVPSRAAVGATQRTLRPDQVGAALESHVALLLGFASIEQVCASEGRVREGLAALDPVQVVALLRKAQAPAALDIMLRWIDRRLLEDRPSWEDALLLGLEDADTDATGLAILAEVAESRMQRPQVRAAAAGFLSKRAATDRLRHMHERFRRP